MTQGQKSKRQEGGAYRPTPVTREQMEEIIKTRKPLGQFYRTGDGGAVGCDNSTGDAWVAEFKTEEECVDWLVNGPRTGYTETEENCPGCMGPCGVCEDTVQDARELEEIVRLGAKMRSAQKTYFRTRTTEWLDESKKLEREFDVAAAKKLDETPKKPTLFD